MARKQREKINRSRQTDKSILGKHPNSPENDNPTLVT
jgi:hypothetical protein